MKKFKFDFQISKVKQLYFSLIIFFLSSCGGSADSENSGQNNDIDPKYLGGKDIYDGACKACHMDDGRGLEGTFPPLAESDYLLADPIRALRQVIEGSHEEMTVNGVVYDAIMPAQDVTEQEAIEVVNYVLNAWGNDGGEVSIDDIKKFRQ